MNKRTILQIGLATIAITLVILVMIILVYFSELDSANFSDGNGLTTGQKEDAIITALTCSDMGSTMLLNPGNFRVEPVSPLGSGWWNGDTGYTNRTGVLAQVPVTMENGAAWFTQRNLIYVDLTRHEVLGTVYADAHHYPASAQVNIPPGSGWYHELGIGSPSSSFRVTYDSGSPLIVPIILDKENLQKALKGETYDQISQSLTVTPDQNSVNGSIYGSRDLFMLINNSGENNTARAEIWFMLAF